MNSRTDWLKLYKKECRSYFKYEASFNREKLQLDEINSMIQDIHSPRTDQASGHGSFSQDTKLLSMIEVKQEVETQIAYYESILYWIIAVNEAISSPAYRAITWQTLIQGKNRLDLLINYEVNPDYVYRMRDKFIMSAIDQKLVNEYERIQMLKKQSKWLSLQEEIE